MSTAAQTDEVPLRFDGADGWPSDARTAVETLSEVIRDLRERSEQLQRALDSRVVIEQAKGVLSERLLLDPEGAFTVLRSAARSAQMPLHELARQVVRSRSNPDPLARELARRPDGAA